MLRVAATPPYGITTTTAIDSFQMSIGLLHDRHKPLGLMVVNEDGLSEMRAEGKDKEFK